MESNFKVECPYCGKVNEFLGDDWCDELIDDSDTANLECMHCDFPMEIMTDAVYTLKVTPLMTEKEREDYINNQSEY